MFGRIAVRRALVLQAGSAGLCSLFVALSSLPAVAQETATPASEAAPRYGREQAMDEHDERELSTILDALKPCFKAHPPA